MVRKSLKELETERAALKGLLKQIVVKKEDSPSTAKLKPSNWKAKKKKIIKKMEKLIEQPSANIQFKKTA